MPEQLFECSLKDLQLSSRTKAIASLNYFFVRSSGARARRDGLTAKLALLAMLGLQGLDLIFRQAQNYILILPPLISRGLHHVGSPFPSAV